MSDIAALFAELAGLAMELDVPDIRQAVLSGRDDGLRAARFDGAGGRSADRMSHPEREALKPTRDRTDADLATLALLEAAYVTAIAEIAVRSRSGAPAETWDEAVKDHQLLAEMDAVGVLERIPGEKPAKWVKKAGDSLWDIKSLARRHLPHVPDATDLLLSGDPVCLSHARIGDYQRARHGDLVLCKTCRDLVAQVATPPEVHKDSEWWPSVEVLREHADMERTGKRTDYHRARSEWIASRPHVRRRSAS